jgi:hypothetical protein
VIVGRGRDGYSMEIADDLRRRFLGDCFRVELPRSMPGENGTSHIQLVFTSNCPPEVLALNQRSAIKFATPLVIFMRFW